MQGPYTILHLTGSFTFLFNTSNFTGDSHRTINTLFKSIHYKSVNRYEIQSDNIENHCRKNDTLLQHKARRVLYGY